MEKELFMRWVSVRERLGDLQVQCGSFCVVVERESKKPPAESQVVFDCRGTQYSRSCSERISSARTRSISSIAFLTEV